MGRGIRCFHDVIVSLTKAVPDVLGFERLVLPRADQLLERGHVVHGLTSGAENDVVLAEAGFLCWALGDYLFDHYPHVLRHRRA